MNLVVFDADRPVRREAIFKADANGATPAVCGERREGDGDDDSSLHQGHAPAHRSSALKERWRTLTSANSAGSTFVNPSLAVRHLADRQARFDESGIGGLDATLAGDTA
jgi:hypothetical protein